MTHVFTTLDEVKAAIGQPLGPGAAVHVGQLHIDAFAAVTGDGQWIHTDPGRAATGPYGTTIAHGFLSLSLLPALGTSVYEFAFGSARINYGLNRVRFPSPVRVNSDLRATVTVTDVTEGPTGATVTLRTVVDAGDPKPACVAESLVLIVD
ncbi:MaoC family dehydratase [Nocardia stercoris]|uniref:MaoC family dehydratase n=1 Tax=Nocardia stercoris TaxID=2483361 RepID=A0A3M2KT04_9NOCA|nr:MaoC family dehydratase [Nocardia stercoris]RMI28797.1 MaoC family dehydratase [Nocardia stercoris]